MSWDSLSLHRDSLPHHRRNTGEWYSCITANTFWLLSDHGGILLTLKLNMIMDFYWSYSFFISKCPRTSKFHSVFVLNLFILWTLKPTDNFYNFSMLRWHRWLKSFLISSDFCRGSRVWFRKMSGVQQPNRCSWASLSKSLCQTGGLGWNVSLLYSFDTIKCDMAFIEPMHRNKPNITCLFLIQSSLIITRASVH